MDVIRGLERTATRHRDADFRRGMGLHRLWLPLSIVWLLTLVSPVADLFSEHRQPLAIAVGTIGMALFIVVDLWMGANNVAKRLCEHDDVWHRWLPPILLISLASGLVLGFGQTWVGVFIFAGGALGAYLPVRDAIRAIGVFTLLVVPVGLLVDLAWGEIAGYGLLSGACGVTMLCLMGVGTANRELNQAREELARLAVTEERLRFARDLHDLLGHSLSVIALKSELAGRLIAVAPDRAADELRDVEAVARKALHEVREAVAGYRQPTLDEELRGGREILAATGISLRIERNRLELPAPVEATLAWLVREGVTNVIRHSRAQRCTVAINARDGGVAIKISDDGEGATRDGSGGSGLLGIAERISALGGRFDAGPCPTGGFQLAAWVPLVETASEARVSQVRPDLSKVSPMTEMAGARPL